MRIHWTIGGFPEFENIPRQARRAMIRRVVGMDTYITLIGHGLLVGGLLAVCGMMITAGQMPWPILLTTFLVGGFGMYQYGLLRIRGQLRIALHDGFVGERLPICLQCGYDLEQGMGERCPECGAGVQPRERIGREP